MIALATQLIKQFEGCRLRAYQDEAGVWTIGWGETAGVQAGDSWSQERADAVLLARVAWFAAGVLKSCPKLLLDSPNRGAACISLAYNIGAGAFANVSSVRRKYLRGDVQGAADAFLLWNKAGGRVSRILQLRRAKERRVFLGEAAS